MAKGPDPFRTKPHSGKKGLSGVRKSTPKAVPSRSPGARAATGGVSPGSKGGKATGLIGQPSVSKTPHIQKRSQLPKARQGASLKRGRSR